jgi:aryl-alcohol dehydrogenase-like predicted oxidoreductase
MREVRLGNTDAFASQISLGCMYFGSKVDQAASFRILDRYREAGGNFLDTADCYAFWVPGGRGDESETTIGRWMRERKNRPQVFVATKLGARPGSSPGSKEGLSPAAIAAGLEGSLRRLGTDHVDLLYTHVPDLDVPLEETLGALDRLVREGKALGIGCSNELAWRVERARAISMSNGWSQFACVQNRYTYLRPKPRAVLPQVCVNDDLLDYAALNRGISLIAYSPLLGGAYKDGGEIPPEYRTSDSKARMAVLTAVAQETGASRNSVALAWMIQGNPSFIPVIGVSNDAQLVENLAALGLQLTVGQMERLTSAAG